MRHNPGYGIMGQLMGDGGIIALGAGHRFGAAEQGFIRHLDVIGGRAIESALTTMLDAGTRGSDEAVDSLNALDRTKRLRRIRQCVAVHLRSVEDVRSTRDTAFAVIVGDIRIGIGLVLLVEDHQGRSLALADLRAKFGPLVICGPDRRAEALALGGDPEADDVDAVIGVTGQGILRHEERLAGPAPGHDGRAGIGLNGGNELAGDLSVDVALWRRLRGHDGLLRCPRPA